MANEVAAIRAELGMTREQFAARVGVVRTTIMRWEKGAAMPREPALRLMRQIVEEYRRTRKPRRTERKGRAA